MERTLILQGFLCIALAAALALAQWLWPASDLELAVRASERTEHWSVAAERSETAPAGPEEARGAAGGCPG